MSWMERTCVRHHISVFEPTDYCVVSINSIRLILQVAGLLFGGPTVLRGRMLAITASAELYTPFFSTLCEGLGVRPRSNFVPHANFAFDHPALSHKSSLADDQILGNVFLNETSIVLVIDEERNSPHPSTVLVIDGFSRSRVMGWWPILFTVDPGTSELPLKLLRLDYVQNIRRPFFDDGNLAVGLQLFLKFLHLILDISQVAIEYHSVEVEWECPHCQVSQSIQKVHHECLGTLAADQVDHQIHPFQVTWNASLVSHKQKEEPNQVEVFFHLDRPDFRGHAHVNIGALVLILTEDIHVAAADEAERFLTQLRLFDLLDEE